MPSALLRLDALVGGCDTAEEDEREEEFVSWAEGRKGGGFCMEVREPTSPEVDLSLAGGRPLEPQLSTDSVTTRRHCAVA